jgi:AbrB family looped-hinge helix DNA binding protein
VIGKLEINDREPTGTLLPMEATVDRVGRIVLPKPMRDLLGLVPGSTVDLSIYGEGLHLTRSGRTARIERRDGQPVAVSDTIVTDDDIVGLIDSGRR